MPYNRYRGCLGWVTVFVVFVMPSAWSATSNFIGPGFDFNTSANWDNGVPNDVAAFNSPNPATTEIGADDYANVVINKGENLTVNQFLFNPGAGAYTFSTDDNTSLTFNGLGVTNNSTNAPTLDLGGNILTFNNNASAGNTNINSGNPSNSINFNNDATAGSAHIFNYGSINFNDNSSAGNSTLSGSITFKNNSTAANAFVNGTPGRGTLTFEDNSSAGNLLFTSQATYNILFQDSATAGYGTFNTLFTNVTFTGNSTAGNATINTQFAQGNINTTRLSFYDNSSAGNATISVAELNTMEFFDNSSGGSANVSLDAGSSFDISNLSSAGTTLGSLSGEGSTNLGSKNLTLTGDASTTISGSITGTGGSLTKEGTGTLTLTGANSYSGGTTIAAGALEGNTASLQGNILNNGSLVFNQTVDGTYSGVLSGNGTLTTMGNNTLNLTGANPFTGLTSVQAGTLALTGSLGGDVLVGNAGTLTGTGSLANLTNNGIVAPGNNGSGTLHVASYAGPGALNIVVNGTSNTSLKVSGNANLTGGTLNITGPLTGPGQYDVVSAGSITGTFASSPVSNMPFLNFGTQYTPTDAFFTVTRSTTTFSSVTITPNQGGIAGALDEAGANRPAIFGRILNAVELLTPAQARAAFAQMSGDALGSYRTAGLGNADHFVRQMTERTNPTGMSTQAQGPDTQPIQLAYAGDITGTDLLQTPSDSLNGLWTRGVGIFDHTNGDATLGSPSSEAKTGGFQSGYDLKIGDQGLLGVSGGYTQTSLTVSDRSSSGNSTAIQLGIYGSLTPDSWIFDGSLSYSGVSNSNTRLIAFPGVDETATASFRSNVFTAFGEAGYAFHPKPSFTFEPSVSLRESHLQQNGYTETGAPGLDLTVGDQNSDSVVSSVGLRLSREFRKASSHPVELGARCAWQHELDDVKNIVSAQFADAPGASFTVQSSPESRDAAGLGLDGRVGLYKNLQAFTDYTATLSSGENIQTILGGLSVRW